MKTASNGLVGTAVLLSAAILISMGVPSGRPDALTAQRTYTGEPLQHLTPAEATAYDTGFALFTKVWTEREGLGPEFNARSCASCHRIPLPGGSGTSGDTFVFHAKDRAAKYGRTSIPALHIAHGEVVELARATEAKKRKTMPLFGLGLLEAVPEEVLLGFEAENTKRGPMTGVYGRAVHSKDGIGRFGWKGNIATLDRFVRTALETEMGLVPGAGAQSEVSNDQVTALTRYIRFLAPPFRLAPSAAARKGEGLFNSIGCAACHRPSLDLPPAAKQRYGSPTIQAYTDLLVHDMGVGLDDGLPSPDVKSREFRTQPLWGLDATGPPYLHDGRATTIDEAIRFHGGEAARAVERYISLPKDQQDLLLVFLEAL